MAEIVAHEMKAAARARSREVGSPQMSRSYTLGPATVLLDTKPGKWVGLRSLGFLKVRPQVSLYPFGALWVRPQVSLYHFGLLKGPRSSIKGSVCTVNSCKGLVSLHSTPLPCAAECQE